MSPGGRLLRLWAPPALLAGTIYLLSSFSQIPGSDLVWDKLGHVAIFGALALLTLRATHGGLGRPLALQAPESVIVFEDHTSYVEESPAHVRGGLVPNVQRMVEAQRAFVAEYGLRAHRTLTEAEARHDTGRAAAGISHAMVAEHYALPGQLVAGTDSHTPHSGALGWVGLISMGSLYYLIPRMFGRTTMYSVPAINLHFWIATLGIVLYIAAMWIAGVMQGLMWRALNPDGTLVYTFVESVKATYPFYAIRLLGGVLYLSGMLVMAWNVYRTCIDSKPAEAPIPAPAHA